MADLAPPMLKDRVVWIQVTGSANIVFGPRESPPPYLTRPEDKKHTLGVRSGDVTGLTRTPIVGPLQGEAGGGVIERSFDPFPSNPPPTLGHMTTLTPSPHPSPVGILVARLAVGSIQRSKTDDLPPYAIRFRLMAAAALHILVVTFQPVPSQRMVEGRCPIPTLLIMTGSTFAARKLTPVGILTTVTGCTLCAQAQECSVQRSGRPLELPNVLRNNPFRLMTGPALGLRVSATEGVSSRVMEKGLCIEMHHPEIFSEMFFMAATTFFVGKQSVIPLPISDSPGQGFVTAQASITIDARGPQSMTLGALPQTLQVGMSLR